MPTPNIYTHVYTYIFSKYILYVCVCVFKYTYVIYTTFILDAINHD